MCQYLHSDFDFLEFSRRNRDRGRAAPWREGFWQYSERREDNRMADNGGRVDDRRYGGRSQREEGLARGRGDTWRGDTRRGQTDRYQDTRGRFNSQGERRY